MNGEAEAGLGGIREGQPSTHEQQIQAPMTDHGIRTGSPFTKAKLVSICFVRFHVVGRVFPDWPVRLFLWPHVGTHWTACLHEKFGCLRFSKASL